MKTAQRRGLTNEKGRKAAKQPVRAKPRRNSLRHWSKKNLTPDDYAFATTKNADCWKAKNTAAGKWTQYCLRCCLEWELAREAGNRTKPPFVTANPELVKRDRTRAPHEWTPLKEITNLEEAIEAIRNQPGFPISTVHVFEIEGHGNTEMLVQRFRNWLVGKDTETLGHQWTAGSAQTDQPAKPQMLPGRVFHLTNGAEFTFRRGAAGRKADTVRQLCALAFRRLKKAGYSRREAARLLVLADVPKGQRDERIAQEQWIRLPQEAAKLIAEWLGKRHEHAEFMRQTGGGRGGKARRDRKGLAGIGGG